MNYLSITRTGLRSFIRKQRYSIKAEGIEQISTCFNPEVTPTYSNGLVTKQTLEKFYPHVGNRDAVGFGNNGKLKYKDCLEFPYPSIRFAQNTPDVMALREEEKQSWSTLSIEKKKALYRASFCNNYAELRAPTGYKKDYVTSMLVMTTLTLLITLFLDYYGFPYKPAQNTKEWEMEVQRTRLLLAHDTIGYHKDYNYDTNKWEK